MNNKDMPLVSVIVPVYKVADYLDRCIESLVNQKYNDLEIILVDDGSPDDCAVICDKWAEKDPRIKVLHKQNGGLSDARNYGMRIISGEYVSFIDSDDYISIEFYEEMLSTAKKRNSDIIECDYVKVLEYQDSDNLDEYYEESNYSASEGLSELIKEICFHPIACNKIYKIDIVKDIYFEIGKYHEDVFWTYQVFGHAKIITKIHRAMYFYYQRESSIMGQGYNLRSLDILEGKWNRQLYIEKYYPELALQSKLDFFGSCIYLMQCVTKYMSGKEKRQAIKKIRNYKKICHISFEDIKSAQGGSKKYYYFAKINILLCCKLRAVLNIGF